MKAVKKTPIYRYLDLSGTGISTKNAVGNYATATPFFITPGEGLKKFIIHRMLVHIQDDANFNAGGYGGRAVLTNGVTVRVIRRDGTIENLTDGVPVKTNSDWARLCYDVTYDEFPAGDNYVHVRWTFSKSGNPIVLGVRDRLEVVLNDNFSAMVGHYFMVQGYEQ